MSNIPADRRYTKSHEWVKDVGDGVVEVGITDYAQDSLGDITYVELPGVGDTLATGAGFGVVESVKAASDLYAPLDGEVVAVNESLDGSPELVNQEPYTGGWILKLKLSDPSELEDLLDSDAYAAEVG